MDKNLLYHSYPADCLTGAQSLRRWQLKKLGVDRFFNKPGHVFGNFSDGQFTQIVSDEQFWFGSSKSDPTEKTATRQDKKSRSSNPSKTAFWDPRRFKW